jgi:hypothetical protein
MTGRDLAGIRARRGPAPAPHLDDPAGAIMHPAPGRGGDVALGARGARRLRSSAVLLEASGGRLARVGAALLQLQREQGNRHVQQVVAALRQTGATLRWSSRSRCSARPAIATSASPN